MKPIEALSQSRSAIPGPSRPGSTSRARAITECRPSAPITSRARSVASVPSGLLLLSADLRVLSANRSFLESYFLRRDEVGKFLNSVREA